jgi:TRAP-type C4-dicarboxylate transport system permease small subunit
MAEAAAEADISSSAKIEEQRRFLPPKWRMFDRAAIRVTEFTLFVVGSLFATMVSLEVTSRYVFNFSILFVNAAARMLLVWFFLLGAGLALRHGAHVGVEFILSRLAPHRRRPVFFIAQSLALVFFLEMVWSGLSSLGPALHQTEPGLEIRLFWGFLAIPVGFALLIYHMLVLMVCELRRMSAGEMRS